MSLMNVVRIAKILALLAFVLPWAAVSCNNVDLATSSGIEMIQGKISANPDANKQMQQQMGSAFGTGVSTGPTGEPGMPGVAPDLGLNFFGIAAAAVIVIGLALSFVGKGSTAARNVLITSLLGMALAFGTVWGWKAQLKDQSSARGNAQSESEFGGMGGMGAMGANMLDQVFQERYGYWITLTALAVAAGAGAIGMAQGATRPQPPAA